MPSVTVVCRVAESMFGVRTVPNELIGPLYSEAGPIKIAQLGNGKIDDDERVVLLDVGS